MSGLGISLISALFGGVISYLITRHLNRVNTTFELHSEFNTTEMLDHRIKAESCISKYSNLTYSEIEFEHGREEELRSLCIIVGFYQKLWLAIKYSRVDKKLIPELFGEIFYWWYLVSFKEKLIPSDWETASSVNELKKWIDKRVDQKKIKQWSRRPMTYARRRSELKR